MSVIKFLTLEQVIFLHENQIEEFGGLHGIKDEHLLQSAISQPLAGSGKEYFHKDIYEMASAYLFHLVKNHAFNDGNKRIAAIVTAVFLEINGHEVIADEDEFERLVLGASQGLLDKKFIANFFKENTRKKL